MTREEAWQGLEGYALFIADGTDLKEALSMAIEALQTPPISQRRMYQAGYRQGREEALKQVTGKLNNSDDSLLIADSEACKEQKSKLDLISRAEAIEALGEEPLVWCDEDYEIAERSQWRADIEAIKSVPTADRPRGYWKRNTTYKNLVFCSECDMAYEAGMTPRNFCPNCGADMRTTKGAE